MTNKKQILDQANPISPSGKSDNTNGCEHQASQTHDHQATAPENESDQANPISQCAVACNSASHCCEERHFSRHKTIASESGKDQTKPILQQRVICDADSYYAWERQLLNYQPCRTEQPSQGGGSTKSRPGRPWGPSSPTENVQTFNLAEMRIACQEWESVLKRERGDPDVVFRDRPSLPTKRKADFAIYIGRCSIGHQNMETAQTLIQILSIGGGSYEFERAEDKFAHADERQHRFGVRNGLPGEGSVFEALGNEGVRVK
jgi:hypothetical protein